MVQRRDSQPKLNHIKQAVKLRPKIVFPVFIYNLIRAAGDEQEEKTGPKSDPILRFTCNHM